MRRVQLLMGASSIELSGCCIECSTVKAIHHNFPRFPNVLIFCCFHHCHWGSTAQLFLSLRWRLSWCSWCPLGWGRGCWWSQSPCLLPLIGGITLNIWNWWLWDLYFNNCFRSSTSQNNYDLNVLPDLSSNSCSLWKSSLQ